MVTWFVMLSARQYACCAMLTAVSLMSASLFVRAASAAPVSAVAPITWEEFESMRDSGDRKREPALGDPGFDMYVSYGTLMVVADPHGGHFDYERNEARSRLPRYPRKPGEIAQALEDTYGARSLLTRGAKSLARVNDAAERSVEAPLNGVNAFTNNVIRGTGTLFGIEELPEFRFKSRTTNSHFGLGLEADW